jgi:phosphopantothenoylcysteine synthetase/decarboxylase
MQFELTDKKILLGVTGSISAYKACELARLFVKTGAEVYVVMSSSATRFVSALTFEALTRNPVLSEESESWASDLNHIDTGKNAIFLSSHRQLPIHSINSAKESPTISCCKLHLPSKER